MAGQGEPAIECQRGENVHQRGLGRAYLNDILLKQEEIIMRDLLRLTVIVLTLSLLPGCAAPGGPGAASSTSKERQLDQLVDDFKTGKITREEYLQKKEQIEKR